MLTSNIQCPGLEFRSEHYLGPNPYRYTEHINVGHFVGGCSFVTIFSTCWSDQDRQHDLQIVLSAVYTGDSNCWLSQVFLESSLTPHVSPPIKILVVRLVQT